MDNETLKILTDMTVKLAEIRQRGCNGLQVENFAEDCLEKLINIIAPPIVISGEPFKPGEWRVVDDEKDITVTLPPLKAGESVIVENPGWRIHPLKELEKWYEQHQLVKSAKCEVFYYPRGSCVRAPKTAISSTVKYKDGQTWHDVCERVGGDYRETGLRIMIETAKQVFIHHVQEEFSKQMNDLMDWSRT